jgi:predicted nucleic acid-binding protein
MRFIVSDTGPLISLERLPDGYTFIQRLYDQVLVPPMVMEELLQGLAVDRDTYLQHYGIAGFLEVVSPGKALVLPGMERLHGGENQAIQLALERELPLLIEEEAGREVALEAGLRISGIAGQLLKAVRVGVLPVENGIEKLEALLRAGRINTLILEGIRDAMKQVPKR